MQCFRLSHAGLVLEVNGQSLIIDPGNFSGDLELSKALDSTAPIAGLVITHEHADHWTPANVAAVREIAPGCPILTTAATASALEAAGINGARAMIEGDTASLGPFDLEFYGGRHEVIHASIPLIDNIGVRVNGTLAYGGDSLTRPPFPADVLGIPIGSPWSNVAQVMDFVLAAKPRRAYLTHDGMLSPTGLALFEARVRDCLELTGGELVRLPRLDENPAARLSL